MTFTVLPDGATVFLDANTLIYHFTADSKHGDACTDLIEHGLTNLPIADTDFDRVTGITRFAPI